MQSRWLLATSLVLLIAACGRAAAPDAGWTFVSAEAFAAELQAGRPPSARPLTLVDVREPELYAAGHVTGAINLPWPGVKETAASTLDKDHAIVLICHGGPMGNEIAARLVAAGFTDVRNLDGGMRAWRGPVEPG